MNRYGLEAAEWRLLTSLKTPAGVQRFLETEIGYNVEPDGVTCYSPRMVLRHRRAHCMEGAMLAAAALRALGFPPLLVDLEAVRDDDHVIAVFRQYGGWGAVAKSNYSGLRYREPVYRTLRELVMSYFEGYFNLRSERTLRAYSRPVNLARFDRRGWMTSEEDVWYIPELLCEVPHQALLRPGMDGKLSRLDKRSFAAGRVGSVDH